MFRSQTVAGLGLIATLLVVAPARAQAPEVMSNDSVVQMVTGKVPKDVILAKIHSTANTFDVTPNGLVGLTKSKIDKDVINAMIAAKTDNKEILNNDAVIAMVAGGVNKEVILFKIHSTKSKFDLTATGLVALSQNKVPQDIVKSMLNVAETAPVEEPPPPPPPAPAPTRGGSAGAGRGTTPPAPAAADKPAAADAMQSVSFTASSAMKAAYEKIRANLAKSADTTIQQADAVLGQITAVHAYKDGTTEHENRIVVKVTSTSGHSTIKVSVLDKTRKTATPPARWSVEKYDAALTETMVENAKSWVQSK